MINYNLMKKCKKCGSLKLFNDFPNNKNLKDGKMNSCKICFYSKSKEKRQKDKEIKIINGEIKTKICNICFNVKRINKFNKSKKTNDGYLDGCTSCKKKLKNIKNFNNEVLYKNCSNCKKTKIIKDFYQNKKSKDGYFNSCKECDKNKSLDYHHNFLKLNTKKKRKYDSYEYKILIKLKKRLRSSICNILKRKGYSKKNSTLNILGCNIEFFKKYLESKFELWMNWDNHGLYNGELNYGWDIDHIIPASSAKNEDDLIRLNHYNNLQPLCSKINRDIKKDLI